MKGRILLFVLSLIVLASTACGFFQTQWGRATDLFAPAQRASIAAVLPSGIFVKSAGDDQVSQARIHLSNGRLALLSEGDGRDSGTYVVSGSQLIIDTALCASEGHGPGYYEWKYDAGMLSLAAASPDPCAAREGELSGTYSLYALP